MRKDDSGKQNYPQSSRIFQEGEHWFFRTRESAPVGPFWNEVEAYIGLRAYLKYQTTYRKAG